MRLTVLAPAFAVLALASAAHAGVTVEKAWARPAAKGLPSAAYFTIRNTGEPDVLEGVSSPVGRASLHMSMDHGGMMMMHPVSTLPIPTGETAVKPGGYHVMLEGLSRPLNPGDAAPLVLTFRKAGAVSVQAEVRTTAP